MSLRLTFCADALAVVAAAVAPGVAGLYLAGGPFKPGLAHAPVHLAPAVLAAVLGADR